MNERLHSVVENVSDVSTHQDLDRLLRQVRRLYDIDNAIYYALSLGGERAGQEFGAMTYPHAWYERYEEVRYRDLDPVVQCSASGFVPINWSELDWSGRPLKRFQAEATEFRVGNQGYTVPIHGPQGQFAMFSVSKQDTPEGWAGFLADAGQDMLLIAHHVHRQVLNLTGAEKTSAPTRLSPRERDVLTLIAEGRSRAQVADRLAISESTLRVYLDSARHKLGGLNTFHAVAIGVKSGIVKV